MDDLAGVRTEVSEEDHALDPSARSGPVGRPARNDRNHTDKDQDDPVEERLRANDDILPLGT